MASGHLGYPSSPGVPTPRGGIGGGGGGSSCLQVLPQPAGLGPPGRAVVPPPPDSACLCVSLFSHGPARTHRPQPGVGELLGRKSAYTPRIAQLNLVWERGGRAVVHPKGRRVE